MKKINQSLINRLTSLRQASRLNKIISACVVLVVVGVGYSLIATRAAGFFSSAEPEQATLAGSAVAVTDPNASGGAAIQFTAPAPPPPPPTTGGWPTPTSVGLKVATTVTMSGPTIDDISWLSQNGFGKGSGTAADPYVVDRVHFTSQVNLGNWDSSNLTGKYIKFTNCRFDGSPGNPTPGGSAALWARDNAPFFTVEDSTLGPASGVLASGGTAAGMDKGIFSYVPFTALRNNIFGANVLVGFEIERNEGPTLIQDNALHDIWSATDDHTDVINGNWHASNITVRHNLIDGIRVGNTYVTNGIGIYDDPGGSAVGIIQNWVIDNNYFDRAAIMILATSDKSRFLDPYVLTNNTFTNRFTIKQVVSRSPSQQSGNVDQTGKSLSF